MMKLMDGEGNKREKRTRGFFNVNVVKEVQKGKNIIPGSNYFLV
jgi:hypothetical protein